MVVGGGNGYDAGPAGYGHGPVYEEAPYDGEVTFGGHEPFLQRWLFSRRLAYLVGALVVVLGLVLGGWWLTSGRYTPVPSVDGMTADGRHAGAAPGRVRGADAVRR